MHLKKSTKSLLAAALAIALLFTVSPLVLISDAAVLGVSINENITTVERGATVSFTATVSKNGSEAITVGWSVLGASFSTIDQNGVLSVATNETATTLTVKATSTADASKFATRSLAVIDVALDYLSLTDAVAAAQAAKIGVTINTAAANVPVGDPWVTQSVMDDLDAAIAAAQGLINNANTQAVINQAVADLVHAVDTFEALKQDGAMVAVVPVASVSLDRGSATINVGGTTQLTATILPTDATDQAVAWTSSDNAVATVDASGLVTGVSAGTATITVTTADGNKTATCSVTVETPVTVVPVTGAQMSEAKLTLPTGGVEQLTASVLPTNASNQAISWSSSDESVATVDQNGLVKGISVGTASIIVTTEDGGHTIDCAVTVVSLETETKLTGDAPAVKFQPTPEQITSLFNDLPPNVAQALKDNPGATVEVSMSVDALSVTELTDAERQLIHGNLDQSETVAVLLDIQLLASVAGETGAFGDLSEAITLTIPVPEEYKGKNFTSVVHIHGDTRNVYPNLSSDPDFIVIEVDGFSKFALVFAEPTNPPPVKPTPIPSPGFGFIGGRTSGGSSGSGRSGGGGGGSGGGGSSGIDRVASSKTTATPSVGVAVTASEAKAATTEAINAAKAAGRNTAIVTFRNKSGISLSIMQEMASTARNSGMTLTIYADVVVDQKVMLRIIFNPADATKDILLGGDVNVGSAAAIRNAFAKHYSNQTAVVALNQQGDFGMKVRIAAKCDLSKLNTGSLVAAAYNRSTNRYRWLVNPGISIDTNGYTHYYTDQAGATVITDGVFA